MNLMDLNDHSQKYDRGCQKKMEGQLGLGKNVGKSSASKSPENENLQFLRIHTSRQLFPDYALLVKHFYNFFLQNLLGGQTKH